MIDLIAERRATGAGETLGDGHYAFGATVICVSLDPSKVENLGKRDPAPATQRDAPKATNTAAVNCKKMPHWKSINGTKINQTHIFCGEWDSRKNRPKGFHSRPGGKNPGSVGSLETSDRADRDGIYGVRWSYAGEGGSDKFSTMFPDRCSADQVLASVSHAANNTSKCPNGAPRWAWCGWSAPRDGGDQYCTGAGGKGFTVAGATLNDGRINTAFPIK